MSDTNTPDHDRTLSHSIPSAQPGGSDLSPSSAPTANEGSSDPTRSPAAAFETPVLPVVPGYEVTREVARGGMGIVYAARDPVFDRELAVKVMHPDQDGGRFVVEAKVTAGLPHPGVPPVYGLGAMSDGRPFLVMKLIEGRTLRDELKAPGRDLPRLLDIFQDICQTVGFAHARGIVHRDLKPANVMIGAFGEVLVVDWGLAKDDGRRTRDQDVTEPAAGSDTSFILSSSAATQAGQVKGTPAFMAPEQARGEPVDARADVFSLGGILTHILTGAPPFAADTVADTVMRAARAELSECFAALDACGADAELIAVTKTCLAPRARERYATGAAVAAAIAAYRAGVEERLRAAERDRVAAEARAAEEVNTRREAEARVEAVRASAAEQRKRRRAQLVVAAVVLLLVGSLGVFAWWRDKQADEHTLADERAAADRARIEADARTAVARLEGERDAEARNKAEQARQGVRAGLAVAADLRSQFKLKPAGEILAQAVNLARIGAPELLDEVERARADLAFVIALDDIRYRKWAWITETGGKGTFNTKSAPPEYRRTFAEHGLDPTTLAPPEAARRIAASAEKAELVKAVDDWALHEPDRAVRDRLLAVARAAEPGPWTDRLRDPEIWSDRPALMKLASEADSARPAPAAVTMLAELMRRNRIDPTRLLSAARVKNPTDFELAFALGQWYAVNRDGRQIGPYEAARALRPDNATVWKNLGVALGWRGDRDDEIAACKEAVRLAPQDAHAHSNLGVALRAKGDLKGALAATREALRLDPESAIAHDTLGVTLAQLGDRTGAIGAFREAVRLDPKLARAHNNLGVALKETGNLVGAIEAYRAAVGADPGYAIAHSNLGVALHIKGELDEAIAEFREAIRLNPKNSLPYYTLGLALKDKGDPDGAISAFKGAILADPTDAESCNCLGAIYLQQRKYPDAIGCARAAIRIGARDGHAQAILGSALKNTGDIPGARAALTEAARLDAKRWGPMLADLPPLEPAPPPREVTRP